MGKLITFTLALGVSLFLLTAPVSAHVIVTPKQVGIASVQEFTMSVPTEKDTPTIGIKLLIPPGLKDVTPNTKPGWTINEQKSGDTVTEIDWTDGSIPQNQRDDFLFQAQVPATESTLKWKAIQQYQDGSVVQWVHDPTSNPEDDSAPPPYSTTMVVNDLTNAGSTTAKSSTWPLVLSVTALLVALASMGLNIIRNK